VTNNITTKAPEHINILVPLGVLTVVTLIAANVLTSGMRAVDSDIKKRKELER